MVVNVMAVNGFCGYGDILSFCCGLRDGLAVLLVSVCQWCQRVAGLLPRLRWGRAVAQKQKSAILPLPGEWLTVIAMV